MMSGITTMLGGGTGPAVGTAATTCTSGPWPYIHSMLRASDGMVMNTVFLAREMSALPTPIEEQIGPVHAD